jgi:hypothetical protein
MDKLFLLYPKLGDLSKTRYSDRTGECCKILRRVLESGEIPIVPKKLVFYRNIFKYDIYMKFMKVQHWISQRYRLACGDLLKSYHWNPISKLHKWIVDFQTIHAKLNSQYGNSREHWSRSQMIIKWNQGSSKSNAAVKWAW